MLAEQRLRRIACHLGGLVGDGQPQQLGSARQVAHRQQAAVGPLDPQLRLGEIDGPHGPPLSPLGSDLGALGLTAWFLPTVRAEGRSRNAGGGWTAHAHPPLVRLAALFDVY
jgi:hypothetical protein